MKVEQVRTNGAHNGSAAVTAHEFHNLISVIIAEAQLLQLDCAGDAPNYRSAVAIERAGRRLEVLIDRLAALRDTPSAHRTSQDNVSPTDTDTSRCNLMEEDVPREEA